jgi:hypothetical protein
LEGIAPDKSPSVYRFPSFLPECAPAQKLAFIAMERSVLSWGWIGEPGSEETLDPVFFLKGQRGFELEYKRFSSFARPSRQ